MGVGRGSKAIPPFSGSGGSGWKPKLTRSTRSAPKTPGALQVERPTLTLLIKWPFCPTCRMFPRPRRQAGSPLLETAGCAHRRRGALLPGPVQPPRVTPPPRATPHESCLWAPPPDLGPAGLLRERQGGEARGAGADAVRVPCPPFPQNPLSISQEARTLTSVGHVPVPNRGPKEWRSLVPHFETNNLTTLVSRIQGRVHFLGCRTSRERQ